MQAVTTTSALRRKHCVVVSHAHVSKAAKSSYHINNSRTNLSWLKDAWSNRKCVIASAGLTSSSRVCASFERSLPRSDNFQHTLGWEGMDSLVGPAWSVWCCLVAFCNTGGQSCKAGHKKILVITYWWSVEYLYQKDPSAQGHVRFFCLRCHFD